MNIEKNKLAKALEYHKAGNLKEAEYLYRQVLESNPNNDSALYFLGILCDQAGKLDEATAYILKSAELNPVFERYRDLAFLYKKSVDEDNMISAYLKAIELKSDEVSIYHELINIFLKRGLVNETIQLAEMAIQLEPTNADVHYILAYLLKEKEDFETAIPNFQKVLNLKPDNLEANYHLGLIFQIKSQVDSAINCFKKVIQIKPDFAEVYAYLGNLYSLKNEYNTAFDYYRKYMEINPNDAENHISYSNEIRYKLRKEHKPDLSAEPSNINFAVVYFYEDTLDKDFYNDFLERTKNQTYKNFEILPLKDTPQNLDSISDRYSHICFVEQGDLISEYALSSVAGQFNKIDGLDLVFSDEDIIDSNNERKEPYFKPEYAPFLLLSHNYMNAFLSLRINTEVIDLLKNLKVINQEALYKIVLKLTGNGAKTSRISEVLYHRHYKNQEKIKDKSTGNIISDEIKSRNYNADIVDYKDKSVNLIKFYNSDSPKVSIIIPFKDRVSFLDLCIRSIESKSTYKNYEIILINNRSSEQKTFDYLQNVKHKVLNADIDFNFAKLNNMGTKCAESDYFLFLNNDMEVLSPDWIETTLGLAQLKNVGAVGAKLLYPNNMIQHAGMVKGEHFFHINKYVRNGDENYQNYADLVREYLSLTGAYLMIAKEKFYKVNGFDENLTVQENDVDLCLKLYTAGYLNIYNPHAVLYHYESVSREGCFTQEVQSEKLYLLNKWNELINKDDPYYNPNFSRILNKFTIKIR